MIITIDGPAASGKSTIAQKLAQALDFNYLNTGLLFRSIAYILMTLKNKPEKCLVSCEYNYLKTIVSKGDWQYTYTVNKKSSVMYNGQEITAYLKEPQVDRWASLAATNPSVRTLIREFQKAYAQIDSLVADGRDLGTIVFPHADHKFFLTADLTIRAQRWLKDQAKKKTIFSLKEAEDILSERDIRDKVRNVAPLVRASDACLVDNSSLSLQETVEKLLSKIKYGCNS